VDVPTEELRQAFRERQRQPGALSQLMRVARHPEVFPQLTALPGVRHLLQLLRGRLSDPQWEWLKSRILQDIGSGQGQPQQPGKLMHLPDATLLALYQSKTCVRISKARQYLGYVPQFDFERGMALTSRFLHWANLA
jgi:hypothetical protein